MSNLLRSLIYSLFFGLLCNISFAQKVFHFDHLLEYEYREEVDCPTKTVYYLTNSKKDNYHIRAERRKEIGDSLYVTFLNYGGRAALFDLAEKDFFTENFNLSCQIAHRYNNKYKYKTRTHHFVKQEDTIIDNEHHQVVILRDKNSKREIRKNECRIHYVFGNESYYNSPGFSYHLSHNEWEKEGNKPSGIPYLIYHERNGKIGHHFLKLKQATRINKTLTLLDNCK